MTIEALTKLVDIVIQLSPAIVAIGILVLARFFYLKFNLVINAIAESEVEKPKREGVSFFEAPTEEPDYVVGFGDDGELIYASEKPKRKNDEVAE